MSISLYTGEHRVLHSTRHWLRQSESAIEAGRLIEAAAYLQRAIREFLQADCDYWDLPRSRTLIGMAKALFLAGQASRGSYSILAAVIASCDRIVRCESMLTEDIDYLRVGVRVMDSFCNATKYLNEGSDP